MCRLRHRKRKTGVVAGASLLVAQWGFAQEASIQELDEFTVFGSHLQNQRAIEIRQDNPTVLIDAVTTDEIGRLPDFNIGEAVQRLPGIGVQQDQAEVRFVTIRALNAEYNYTTVDGVSIAVPDRNGRRVFMDVMPASMAYRVEVAKTFVPGMEGGAIGGIIDIQTADAFAFGRDTFKVNAEIGKYTNDDGYRSVNPSGTADLFYSGTFGADNQFGVVLTGNYYKRDSTIPQTEYGSSRAFYDANGDPVGTPDDPPYPGTGWEVPRERRGYWYHNDRTRFGGSAKFQYRPADMVEFWVRGFWNKATDDEARQTDLLRHSGGGELLNQTATTGTLITANSLRQQHYLGQFEFERSVWAATLGGDFDLDAGNLALRANYSGSKFSNPENWAEWRMQGDNDGDGVDDNAFSYERIGDDYAFTLLDPEAYYDFTQYEAYRRQFDDRSLDEDLFELKADWDGQMGSGVWSYGAGLSWRRVDRTFDEERDRYRPTGTNDYTLDAAGVLNTEVNLQPPGFIGNQSLVVIDPDLATSQWEAHFGANADQWSLDSMERDDNRLDYTLEESVSAAYAWLGYQVDRTNLVFGLRYEDTSVDGLGRRNVSGIGWTDTENSGGYSDLLPSISYSYRVNQNHLLRAAVSKSVGRPGYNLIAPVGESFNPDSLTLSRSNPDLEPRRSTNVDLGWDFYFDNGFGLVSAGLFYKQVEGEIFRAATEITIDVDGVATEVTATQPINNGDDTNIYGLEVQAIKNLDGVVPGLGFNVNATFLETDFTVLMNDGSKVELETMIGQPKQSYNVSLFYDRGRWSTKLAYRYQSLSASSRIRTDQEYRNRYDTERQSLDFKATYRMNDHWAFNFNAWNLTGEGRGEVLGFDQEIPIVSADFGSAYFIGFSYKN